MIFKRWWLFLGLWLVACTAVPESSPITATPALEKNMRYLALGDSYTIGENVAEAERWPVQLAARLSEQGIPTAEPEIIAVTGWTTDELAAGIHQAKPQGPYDLVTLLIGVNNQYRGRDPEEYRQQFADLLQQAIGFARDEPARVIVLSIPDWGVTPYAAGRDTVQIAAEIDAFNAINREEAEKAGVAYVDVTAVSRQAAHDSSLIAADGLHPSGKMYAAWVELLLPVIGKR
jgi:lysophospholipase L1-like esterase